MIVPDWRRRIAPFDLDDPAIGSQRTHRRGLAVMHKLFPSVRPYSGASQSSFEL
jgi:hypothetical protein